jgi:hypothetical protein
MLFHFAIMLSQLAIKCICILLYFVILDCNKKFIPADKHIVISAGNELAITCILMLFLFAILLFQFAIKMLF